MWVKGSAGGARFDPGSKKPEPAVEVPVTITTTEVWPEATLVLTEAGAAGGGAISLQLAPRKNRSHRRIPGSSTWSCRLWDPGW